MSIHLNLSMHHMTYFQILLDQLVKTINSPELRIVRYHKQTVHIGSECTYQPDLNVKLARSIFFTYFGAHGHLDSLVIMLG